MSIKHLKQKNPWECFWHSLAMGTGLEKLINHVNETEFYRVRLIAMEHGIYLFPLYNIRFVTNPQDTPFADDNLIEALKKYTHPILLTVPSVSGKDYFHMVLAIFSESEIRVHDPALDSHIDFDWSEFRKSNYARIASATEMASSKLDDYQFVSAEETFKKYQ